MVKNIIQNGLKSRSHEKITLVLAPNETNTK